MAKYQITATIEKIGVENNQIKLQLKGCGKYFFEYEMDAPKTKYNILEPCDKTAPLPPPIFLELDKDFMCDPLLFPAFIENKRLKLEVEMSGTYSITSILRED